MSRRARLALTVLVLALIAAFVAWRLRASRGVERASAREPAAPPPESSAAPDRDALAPPAAPDAARPVAAPLDHTVRDRALRDEVRRAIYAAWAASTSGRPGAAAPPPADPLHDPMPQRDGGGVDPEYIRERIREDFVPMARVCYEQYLARQPGRAMQTTASFVIVGDRHVGGVVDEVELSAPDGGLGDREFDTCVRESMAAMAFRPPPGDGRVRVRYPFRFSPEEPDDGGADASSESWRDGAAR